MTERQIKRPGDVHRRNVLRSLYNMYMKFYPIWYKGCVEMALDRQTEGRTDEAVTIYSLFGEHDKQYNYFKK